MSVENPIPHDHDERIVRACHRFAFRLGGDPELLDTVASQLIDTLLDAATSGMSREDIEAAVRQGLHQGELQCADASLTPEYWDEVRDELEVQPNSLSRSSTE